jgi:O-acetylhomoserine (thiol)-lyase
MGGLSGSPATDPSPDPGYGHRNYLDLSEPFGPIAFVLRAQAALLRDLGPSLSPQNAFQLILGLETLPLRIQRQFDNAAKVADFIVGHMKSRRSSTLVYRPGSTESARTNT